VAATDVSRLGFVLRPGVRRASTSSALLVCVYRLANAPVVMNLLAEARHYDWPVRLWALDEAHPDLREVTVGSGAGTKFELVERLLGTGHPSNPDWLIVVDDDVEVTRGSLALLLDLAARCGFAIAQAAHAPGSHWSHRITVARPFSIARLTRFVEIGPLFVIDSAWRERFLSNAERYGMGWGLEFHWQSVGAPMGIVDLVHVKHLGAVGHDYQVEEGREQVARESRTHGLDYETLQARSDVWRPWQRTPAWLRRVDGRGNSRD